jgi:dephospho-CoA kinase
MRVGVTGGIGSGKTTVCRIFGVLQIPVFDADSVAQLIIGTDQRVRQKLSSMAGTDLFLTGSLDRKLLAGLIFNDRKLLQRVNDLIHPLVFESFEEWASCQNSPYVILDAAILFESGADNLVDKTVTVVTPVEERIRRVAVRNNLTVTDVNDRIKNQISDEERLALADYSINNGDTDMVIPAVLKLHSTFLNLINSNDE